jgi:hypothetical protein
MNYDKLEYFISQPRLNRFLTASGNSKTKAQKLYHANLAVAQSFYPMLNLFEIFFRNVCNYRLSAHFVNPNWIITEKNGFMADKSLEFTKFYLKESVKKAEQKIKKNGTLTAGKILAEQSFGFWTSLFEKQHYRLIGGSVIQCFPNKPKNIDRKKLSTKLNKIRDFRNRIYHNEPVCFNGNSIDFTYAAEIKNELYELLSWIDHELPVYVKTFDTIDNKINSANRIKLEKNKVNYVAK